MNKSFNVKLAEVAASILEVLIQRPNKQMVLAYILKYLSTTNLVAAEEIVMTRVVGRTISILSILDVDNNRVWGHTGCSPVKCFVSLKLGNSKYINNIQIVKEYSA